MHSFAQETKFDFNFKHFITQKPFVLNFDSKPVSLFASSLNNNLFSMPAFDITHGSYTPVIESAVHYTAFFCKMENRFRDKFNVWIKIRAGNDDEYRKLIEER